MLCRNNTLENVRNFFKHSTGFIFVAMYFLTTALLLANQNRYIFSCILLWNEIFTEFLWNFHIFEIVEKFSFAKKTETGLKFLAQK